MTVPTLGLGINPLGPKICANGPNIFIASGVAITTSKFISPAFIFSARSSYPTMSAPAFFAASAASPWANTATRVVLPVPFGRTIEPLTD